MKPEMHAGMTCAVARVELSARIDGETDDSVAVALDRHLVSCEDCRRHDRDLRAVRTALRVASAEDVPDLTSEIMDRVTKTAPSLGRHAGRWARVRTALVAAAATVALLLGVSAPWLDRPGDVAGAREIVGRMRRAARALDTYRATYTITERGWHPDVRVRQFVAKLWFDAPERFRMELRDLTAFPQPDLWPRNDVDVVATPDRWWIGEPFSCPVQALPDCATAASRSERSLVHRTPFDGTTALPTDIILPLETLGGAGGFEVSGPQTVTGRSAYRIDLNYRTARPLVAALQAGGAWRPFHPLDPVRLWIDEATWFPLRFEVLAGRSSERDLWAESLALDDTAGEVLLDVRADSFSTPDHIRPRRFSTPAAEAVAQGGFVPGPPALFSTPGAPDYTADLKPYRAGTTDAGTILTYSNGMTWLKVVIGDPASRPERVAGADPSLADEVTLGSGFGYYRPSTETLRRQIDVFDNEAHVHLESNLRRAELMRVASSTGVRGKRVEPASARRGTSFLGGDELEALDRFSWVRRPGWLPFGYDPSAPGAAAVSRSRSSNPAVVLYYRNPEAEFDGSGIRITQSKGATLPPSSELFVTDVAVNGAPARWASERGELEWRQGGVYRAVRAPSFDLSVVHAIAEGLR